MHNPAPRGFLLMFCAQKRRISRRLTLWRLGCESQNIIASNVKYDSARCLFIKIKGDADTLKRKRSFCAKSSGKVERVVS